MTFEKFLARQRVLSSRARFIGRQAFATLAALALMGAAGSVLTAKYTLAGNTIFDGDIKQINLVVDKTAGGAKLLPEKDRKTLVTVFENPVIFLDLKVILDGTDGSAVTTRVEESTVPEPVPCDVNNYGRLIMGPDIEYLVSSAYKFKNQPVNLTASIFPGQRTEFHYNEVSCNFYADNTKASFEVTGFYYVHINPVKDGFDVQLRPISPSYEVAKNLISKSPLKKLQDRINAESSKVTDRARGNIDKLKQGLREFFKENF